MCTATIADPLHASILAALQAGERNIYELAKATGVDKGPRHNPLASKLNRALVALRDAGQIVANQPASGFGEMLFALADPHISMRSVRVHFANGDHLTTSINGTRAAVNAHYLGQRFELDETQPAVECVRVDFLD